jgi:hypothetical protein
MPDDFYLVTDESGIIFLFQNNGDHHQPGHNRNLYQHLLMISNLNSIAILMTILV